LKGVLPKVQIDSESEQAMMAYLEMYDDDDDDDDNVIF